MSQSRQVRPQPGVEIDGLTLRVDEQTILQDIHLTVASGECLAIIGASGAGKTSLLQLIGGMNPGDFQGSVTRFGQPYVAGYTPQIGWLPQGLADNLNPHMTIVRHLKEAFDISVKTGWRQPVSRGTGQAEILRIAEQVYLPASLLHRYPRHLSGGEIQRVLLALSLVAAPELLLLDEPTASLDSKTKEVITQTLSALKSHKTLILVTHDLDLARKLADRVIVMRKGRITGCDKTGQMPELPASEINDSDDAAPFVALSPVRQAMPPVLTLEHLNLKAGERTLFTGFGMRIYPGETVLIYGESGRGKTTLARLCAGWDPLPRGATINRNGFCVYLSQHPRAACAPHFSLKQILLEPMQLSHRKIDDAQIRYWLRQVHLPVSDAFLSRKPTTLSGGELQRLLIVRAMLAEPEVLIADEPTSALDPDLKQEMMACFQAVQRNTRCALIIFTHDPVIQDLMQIPGQQLSASGLVPYAAFSGVQRGDSQADEENRESFMAG